MYLLYAFLGFIVIGAVGVILWEYSKKSRMQGLVGACFWIALIGGFFDLYKFNFLNLLGAWALCSFAMAAAYSYSTVALNEREKEIAQCQSTIETLKRKDTLTTEEEKRLHKLEKFLNKAVQQVKEFNS